MQILLINNYQVNRSIRFLEVYINKYKHNKNIHLYLNVDAYG